MEEFFLVDYSRALRKRWVLQFAQQLVSNHGRNVSDLSGILTCEHLWLAAHGKPVVSNLITSEQAEHWLKSQDAFFGDPVQTQVEPLQKETGLFSSSKAGKKR